MRYALLLLLFACVGYAADGAVLVGPNPTAATFFATKIQPVLVEHCYACHAGTKRYGGLKVDALDTLLAGGHDEGPAVIPGDTQHSSLLRALRYEGDSDLNMPPNGKLPDAVIADFERWIDIGAPWPDATAATVAAAPPPPKPPYLGRLHPVLVHLPIAALLLAALAEFLVLVRGAHWKPTTAILAVTGTLGAIGAIITGVNLEGAQEPQMLARHELLGWLTLVGGLTACSMLLAMRWVPLRRWPLFAILLLTALLAGLTGHIGGAMVWGADWLALGG
jgi:uncharacterized membrane protein